MSEIIRDTKQTAAISRSRRWLVAVFFSGWTVLAAIAIWWLIGDAAKSGNTVIRVGSEEAKAWGTRLHETVALARLNFPWALPWIFLTPYALWVGVRYNFEGARWRRRLTVLLASGAGFIWASQWLSERLGAGQAMIVMVNYTADTAINRIRATSDRPGDPLPRGFATNRLVTNRITKVMISGETAHPTNHASWEIAASEIMSGLGTNLPHLLAGGMAGDLPPPLPLRKRRWSAVLDGLAYVALIGLAHAGVFHRRYREREQQAAILESRLNQARLRALQAQLQPHFLFNTLNGIATLLRRDPATAEEMLLSLSDLLRISLSSSHRQEIPLREEMDFLGRYLAIQRMRFGDRLQTTEEIAASAMDCLVPALLLQPLVENAIRHGLEPSGKPGELRIAGARDGEWLRLTVEDDGVGLPKTSRNEAVVGQRFQPVHPDRQDSCPTTNAGVGIANVRERLAALYGEAYEFSIAERPGGGVVVNIKLPARASVDAPERNEGIA